MNLIQAGHKYLFSEVALNWEDARAECELYGGWIVDVNDVYEENCLLQYATTTVGIIDTDSWFWTDGKMSQKYCLQQF